MNNINDVLTAEEKAFIASQGLDVSDFFDARGMGGPKNYHDLAKAQGCRFVINNTCNAGHRLKTRSGHCIMCNTATIAFQTRDSIEGTIYLAISGELCKIGVIDSRKNSTELLGRREYQINSEGGYGGRSEWRMIKKWSVPRNLGKVEHKAHELLKRYKVDGKMYKYSNERREADELYKCTIQNAVDAVKSALEAYK